MPPVSVLIKPASGKCNMRCRYCFYHAVAENRSVTDYGFMALETLEKIVEKVLHFADENATFSFQGGEPTLCGLVFYEHVVALQKKHNIKGVKIQNRLQTNGLLLDESWARFLHENSFLVGLSLDGFKKHNDLNRVDAVNEGTFDRIMQAAALLSKYAVDFNILLVVTSHTAQFADKIYDFFLSQQFSYLQFIPCIDNCGPQDVSRGKQIYALSPESYTFFLKHFFDRWYDDLMYDREVSIRYFENLVRMVMGLPPETCSMMGSCSCQFVFEADGSAYPCDFYVTDAWRMGNIYQDDLMALYESENSVRFMKTSRNAAAECRGCEWLPLCKSGCRRDRENSETGELGQNRYCRAYKAFLRYAYPKLVETARYVSAMNKGKKG